MDCSNHDPLLCLNAKEHVHCDISPQSGTFKQPWITTEKNLIFLTVSTSCTLNLYPCFSFSSRLQPSLPLARFTRVMRSMHEESFNLEFSTQPLLLLAPLWMLCGNSRLRYSGSARVNLVSRMWIHTGYLTALGLQNLFVYALWISQQLSVYFIVLPASILTLFAYSLNGWVVTKTSFGKHSLYSKHKGNHSYFRAHINNHLHLDEE